MNVHVFHHRFPALAAAVFASLGLAFVAIAGTTCSFLNVEANEGRFIEFTSGVPQEAVTLASFGVLCDTYYFDSEGDTMWRISKIFLYVSLALGGFAVVLSWAITWCISPTVRLWKLLSVTSALNAVLSIPIFLLFESEPCTLDNSRQQCSLSFGSFLLMSGVVSSIAVVLLTQCVETPSWGTELDAWKVGKREREESAHISRGMIASDEYGGSEYDKNPENPPDAATAEATNSAGSVATVGLFAGFQRWRERQKWARSSDLKQVKTSSSSHDEEAAIPFAEAGSYYANSNNSRLLLKVPPDGRHQNEDQGSMASFADIDEYVKMVEDGKIDDIVSLGSMEQFAGNGLEADADDDATEAAVMLVAHDYSEPKAVSVATTDGKENFADEPQFYSEMKAPPSLKEEQGLLDVGDNTDDSQEEADVARESKISRGIRSLTSRVIRDTNRRTKSGKMYAAMDDDDASGMSGLLSPETDERELGETHTDTGKDYVTDDESTSKVRSPTDTDHLHHQTLLFDWNALHAAANAGILLARDDSYSDDSSDEDEPAQIVYTSDDTFGPGSHSSFGNPPNNDEEDDKSAFSGSTISDISDKEDDDNLLLGDGVAAASPSPRKKRSPRKSPRRLRRDYSSCNSISSYTSLLDMTIDEETDLDLREFESSEDDRDNIQSGYKSAPEAIGDRKQPYAFIQSESSPAAGERGYIVPRSEHLGSDSSEVQDLARADTSTSQTVATQDDSADAGKNASYHSDGSVVRERKLKSVDEEDGTSLCFRRSRSMSLPRRRKSASVHPLVSPASSPRALEARKGGMSWREERLFKGGIHSESSHIISDSETSEEKYASEASARSAKSNLSRRARKARIRRLQSESSTKRQRSRTLDPPKARRRYDRQSTNDGVPESHNVTLNRLLFGSDHGPEEASL